MYEDCDKSASESEDGHECCAGVNEDPMSFALPLLYWASWINRRRQQHPSDSSRVGIQPRFSRSERTSWLHMPRDQTGKFTGTFGLPPWPHHDGRLLHHLSRSYACLSLFRTPCTRSVVRTSHSVLSDRTLAIYRLRGRPRGL